MGKKKRRKGEGDDAHGGTGSAGVLIAGEDERANELIARLLSPRGFAVTTATDVDSALASIANVVPSCAVVGLSGSGMGSSMVLLDAIRQHDDARVRNMRVIVLADTDANHNFAFQSGADYYLQRPFHIDEVHDAVVRTLRIPPEERAVHRRQMLKT